MAQIVVGLSGASGSALALHLVQALKQAGVGVHLVVSHGAKLTWQAEMETPIEELYALADVVYDNQNVGAAIASGSFEVEGMIIVPCSMKSVSALANGYSDNLLIRAGDVCIKEKRPLVLCFRENPLSAIHLQNLAALSSLQNVWLMPMVMTYYNHPSTIEDMENTLIGRMMHVFGLKYEPYKRWKG
jgi:4-hydroxy-3-polyprenylbenzoate decarboxylase